MVSLVKNVTEINNIYTYFEFSGYNGWIEFEELSLILCDQINCREIERLDGIYSRHSIMEKDGFVFKLMYHEDFGNCLCNQDKQDDEYYHQLEEIGRTAISMLNL